MLTTYRKRHVYEFVTLAETSRFDLSANLRTEVTKGIDHVFKIRALLTSTRGTRLWSYG